MFSGCVRNKMLHLSGNENFTNIYNIHKNLYLLSQGNIPS